MTDRARSASICSPSSCAAPRSRDFMRLLCDFSTAVQSSSPFPASSCSFCATENTVLLYSPPSAVHLLPPNPCLGTQKRFDVHVLSPLYWICHNQLEVLLASHSHTQLQQKAYFWSLKALKLFRCWINLRNILKRSIYFVSKTPNEVFTCMLYSRCDGWCIFSPGWAPRVLLPASVRTEELLDAAEHSAPCWSSG